MKVLLITTLLAGLALPVQPEPPCWQIRLYVTLYGEKAAILWAREHGFSASQIEEARRLCLAK